MNDIPASPATPEAGMTTVSSDERNLAVLAHLSGLCGAFIPLGNIAAPVLFWVMQKDKSEFVGEHAKAAVNFQITSAIAFVACLVLMVVGIGFLLLPLLGLAWLIITVLAAVTVARGDSYRYPVSLELLK